MFFKYQLLLSIIVLFLHFLPHIYSKRINLTQYYLNKALQIIIIVSIYSIFMTQGITIFTYVIFLILLVVFVFRKEFSLLSIRFIPRKEELQYLFLIVTIFSIINILHFFSFSGSPSSNFITYVNDINIVYSNISTFLNSSGVETSFINNLFPNTVHPSIYHYFELWLNALLINLFDINSLESLLLLTYTLLKTLIVLATMAYISPSRITRRSILGGIFILFFSGIYIPSFYDKTFFSVLSDLNWNGWAYSKLLSIYFIVTLFMVTLQEVKKKIFALMILSLLPIFYPTTLFGYIGLSLGILSVKFYSKEKLFGTFVILILPIIFFQFFYFYLGESLNSILPTSITEIYLSTAFHIIIGAFLFLFILYSSYIILLGRNFIKNIQIIIKNKIYIFSIFILGLSLLSSIFGWALLHETVDSGQILSNYLAVIQIILFFILFKKLNRIKILLFILFITINIILNFKLYNINKKYEVQERVQVLKSIFLDKRIGVIYFPKKHYFRPFNHLTLSSLPFPEVFLISSNFKFYDINKFDIDFSSMKNKGQRDIYTKSQQKDSLYLYQKLHQNSKNIRLDFLKEYQIEFLMYKEDEKIPESIKEFFKKKVKYKNWIILLK